MYVSIIAIMLLHKHADNYTLHIVNSQRTIRFVNIQQLVKIVFVGDIVIQMMEFINHRIGNQSTIAISSNYYQIIYILTDYFTSTQSNFVNNSAAFLKFIKMRSEFVH